MPTATLPALARERLSWDVFCRVIDNHGDLGVCWRLCAQLAAQGQAVRLWCDDSTGLQWMAPPDGAGVTVRPWREPQVDEAPGDVVIEAFGCDPPAGFIARMAARPEPPVWINLEYLSAEAYVERSHGLASPQFSGPGRGLTKWFFYPGFTPATGGLLREPGLIDALAAVDRQRFLASLGTAPQPGERVVSWFAYDASPLDTLLQRLGPQPVLLLACPGPTREQALAIAGRHAQVHSFALPWLAQRDFDRLLASADLNLVRGEDSFVRALWAGQPWLWQIYRQDDGAHAAKLDAFLRAMPTQDAALTASFRAWNHLGAWPATLPEGAAWRSHAKAWRGALRPQPDLLVRLLQFVRDKRLGAAR